LPSYDCLASYLYTCLKTLYIQKLQHYSGTLHCRNSYKHNWVRRTNSDTTWSCKYQIRHFMHMRPDQMNGLQNSAYIKDSGPVLEVKIWTKGAGVVHWEMNLLIRNALRICYCKIMQQFDHGGWNWVGWARSEKVARAYKRKKVNI
jgi:hypothetical protein